MLCPLEDVWADSTEPSQDHRRWIPGPGLRGSGIQPRIRGDPFVLEAEYSVSEGTYTRARRQCQKEIPYRL